MAPGWKDGRMEDRGIENTILNLYEKAIQLHISINY